LPAVFGFCTAVKPSGVAGIALSIGRLPISLTNSAGRVNMGTCDAIGHIIRYNLSSRCVDNGDFTDQEDVLTDATKVSFDYDVKANP
jgi:hypothetical protein